MNAREEWRRGWPVVLASLFGFAIPTTFIYSMGSLIAPIEAEYGWSRGEISAGLSILTLTGAVLSPFVGMAIDRFGPRRIGLPGALLMFSSFGIITLTTADVRVWWALWFVLTLAALWVKPMVWTTAVASTFTRSRGLALAVTVCGSGVGSAIVPLLSTWLIDHYGWRAAVPMMSGIIGVVVLPILYFGLHSGADERARGPVDAAQAAPMAPGMSAREVFTSVRFLKIGLAGFAFTLGGMGLGTNFIPIFTSFGIGRGEAAAIAGISGISAIAGRLITGAMLDRWNANLIGGVCMLLPIISCLLLLWSPGNVAVAAFAILIFGLTNGAEVDIIAFLTAQQFGTARYGTIFGVIAALWAFATSAGPLIVNHIYDVTGGYALALQLLMPVFVIGALAILTLGKPPHFDEPAEAAA